MLPLAIFNLFFWENLIKGFCIFILFLIQDSARDFYESARRSTNEINLHLSRISDLKTAYSNRASSSKEEIKTFLKTLNLPPNCAPDEELETVSREFTLLNTNFFQCLESHRYYILENWDEEHLIIINIFCFVGKVFVEIFWGLTMWWINTIYR